MTKDDAWNWHKQVQPLIKKIPDRADQQWIWPLHRSATLLSGDALGQRPRAKVLELIAAAKPEIPPCVMLVVVEAYPAVNDHGAQSVFVWYISPAPTEYFTAILGYPPDMTPKRSKLMAIGMDIAVAHSFKCGRRGYVGLHAAKEGGDDLYGWYLNDGGMTPLPKTSPLPLGIRWLRGNDGRYFYHTHKSANKVTAALSELRETEV